MARAQAEAFKRIVTVGWPAHQAAAAKAHLIATARAGHAKIMGDAQMRGSKPDFDAYANTPLQTNIDAVILPGPIVYRYRYIREVVAEAIRQLRAASPISSGAYARSHQIFVDGVPVDALPMNLKATADVMIANTVPYARRLEVGKTKSGRAFLISVPNRIYERTARKLKAKYGQVAKIESTFVSLPGAYALKRIPTGRARRGRGAGSAVTFPAIRIGLHV